MAATTGVCLTEGLKLEKNEAIGYHDDGREGGGGGRGGWDAGQFRLESVTYML